MLDVLVVVSSDPRYDSRSSKYLSCLLDAGINAKVVGISSDGETSSSDTLIRAPISQKSGKKFFLQFYQRLIPEIRKSPAKVLIAGDLFSLLPAIINKRRNSRHLPVKLIYDSKELYAELPSLKVKRSSFLFWTFLETLSVKYIDQVITVNKSIADILEAKWNLPVTVIMNVPNVTRPTTILDRSLEKVTITFSGGLQGGRGLHSLIKLLTLLPDNYKLRFVGDGGLRSELERFAASLNLSGRVQFVGRVKNDEVISELSKGTLGIYLMENSGLCHYLALPNKLFQFISARIPVIVSAFPEMEKIVTKFGLGAAVDPTDLDSVATKVLELTRSWQDYLKLVENCDRAAKVLNWETEKEKFVGLIKNLI